MGYDSLYANTTGNNNSAMGYDSLYANTTGYRNSAMGYDSLYDLTEGIQNTAIGYNTGRGITTGDYNTIIGANVTGLDADLSNNIIIADGEGNQRINVDENGNVGIGTTAPETNLHIAGTTGVTIGKDATDGTVNNEGILKMWSDGDNAYSTTIKTGTQTQNVTYTLPLNDGDAGQVLTTDGNGVLSWTTP